MFEQMERNEGENDDNQKIIAYFKSLERTSCLVYTKDKKELNPRMSHLKARSANTSPLEEEKTIFPHL